MACRSWRPRMAARSTSSENCQNGYLINPLDKAAMAEIILKTLSDKREWTRLAKNGIEGVRRHYSWQAHVEKYLSVIRPLVEKTEPIARMNLSRRPGVFRDRAIFTSLDLNLIGDRESLALFLQHMQAHRKSTIFGIATGRRLDDALGTLRKYNIPEPDVLISSQGTEIHYAPNLTQDTVWERHINHLWNPQAVRDILKEIPGLVMQPKNYQSAFKISYYIDPNVADVQEIRQTLLRNEQAVNAVFSFGQFLDVLPIRASKGLALRWCADQLGFPLENTLVAGVTGADADMLRGNTLGTVVDNRHLAELSELANVENIYFSEKPNAAGILEAMEHYRFFADEARESRLMKPFPALHRSRPDLDPEWPAARIAGGQGTIPAAGELRGSHAGLCDRPAPCPHRAGHRRIRPAATGFRHRRCRLDHLPDRFDRLATVGPMGRADRTGLAWLDAMTSCTNY